MPELKGRARYTRGGKEYGTPFTIENPDQSAAGVGGRPSSAAFPTSNTRIENPEPSTLLRRRQPARTVSSLGGLFDEQDLSGFSQASQASGDLNVALGMDRKTDLIGPDMNGALGPIWNQVDDVNSEQLQLLKSVYGVTSREQLVKKLQEQMGLRKKETHPLLKYRQASFIHGLTTNHYPCSFARYAFEAEGNVKSTI